MAKKKVSQRGGQVLHIRDYETPPRPKITEYEKLRLMRMKENKLRLDALRLKEMAEALLGGSERGLEKSDKGKEQATTEDEEYLPEEDDELYSDHDLCEDLEAEGAINDQRSKPPPRKSLRVNSKTLDVTDHLKQGRAKLLQIASTTIDGSSMPFQSQHEKSPQSRDIIEVPPSEDLLSKEDLPPHQDIDEQVKDGNYKKKRGPTMCKGVYDRDEEQRVEIKLNDDFQAVGPKAGEFTSFLGTIARNVRVLPLTTRSRKNFGNDKKEELWEYVNKYYIVPNEGKKWVLKTINDNWRGYKSRLRKLHFKKYNTNELRMKHRPSSVPEKMFKALLQIWNDQAHKEMCEKNSQNRQVLTEKNVMHTTGSKSFARLKEDWKESNKTKKDTSPMEMFMETRKEKITKRKEGDARDKIINELKERNSTMKDADVESSIATIFNSNVGKRRSLRLFGRGVTCTQLKQKAMLEELKKQKDEEVQAIRRQHENQMQINKAEIAHGLRAVMSELEQHNPGMRIDLSVFGSFFAKDRSCEDATCDNIAVGTMHNQLSGTNDHISGKEAVVEDYEEDNDEDDA